MTGNGVFPLGVTGGRQVVGTRVGGVGCKVVYRGNVVGRIGSKILFIPRGGGVMVSYSGRGV